MDGFDYDKNGKPVGIFSDSRTIVNPNPIINNAFPGRPIQGSFTTAPQPDPDDVIRFNLDAKGGGIPHNNRILWSSVLGSDIDSEPVTMGLGFEHNLFSDAEVKIFKLLYKMPITGEIKTVTWDISDEDLENPSRCLILAYLGLPLGMADMNVYTNIIKHLLTESREYKQQLELEAQQIAEDEQKKAVIMEQVDDVLEGVF